MVELFLATIMFSIVGNTVINLLNYIKNQKRLVKIIEGRDHDISILNDRCNALMKQLEARE